MDTTCRRARKERSYEVPRTVSFASLTHLIILSVLRMSTGLAQVLMGRSGCRLGMSKLIARIRLQTLSRTAGQGRKTAPFRHRGRGDRVPRRPDPAAWKIQWDLVISSVCQKQFPRGSVSRSVAVTWRAENVAEISKCANSANEHGTCTWQCCRQ